MNRGINALFLLLITFNLSAQQIGGNSVYKFLNLSNSARIASLGGNMIGIKDDDVNLSILNPSVLDSTMDNRLALSYVNYFAGVNYGYVAYAKHFNKIGTFSLGTQYIDYGVFTQADATGLVTGEFKAADYSFNLAYARTVAPNLNVGSTLKFIYSALEQYTSNGLAFDLAATYYKEEKQFGASLLIKNIGVQLKPYRDGNREPLPFEIEVGISKKPLHMPIRLCLTLQHLQQWDLTYEDPANPSVTTDPLTGEKTEPNKYGVFFDKLGRHILVGAEVILSKNFFIRIGYNYQRYRELRLDSQFNTAGFTGGFGFKVYKFNISYGRAQYHAAGGSNTFTIAANLGEFYSKK